MLPFLKLNHESNASASLPVKREPDSGEDFDTMETAAQDLCDAVHKKDIKAVAAALKAAFDLYESEPHEEGEHVDA